jgi:hypothetical protein
MCLSKLLADLFLIFIFEGRKLVAFTRIKKLPGHARLADRDAHPALKLASGNARWNFGVSRDDNLLLPVILRLTFAEVLGLLGCSILIALIKVLDDCCVQVLDLLFQWR